MMDSTMMTTLTENVARYIVQRQLADWTDDARDKVCIHIYDTLLAMLSGRHLIAGQKALSYQKAFCSSGTARIVGTDLFASPEIAAMVNGMFAHADETDDTSETARMHPGASIIPAVLALADHLGSNGADIVNAVLIGYQVGIAFPKAIWAEDAARMHSARATHNAGQVMGSVAACSAILKLDTRATAYALSYAAQLCSGVNSLYRERSHVEKAYVFGGMPAEQGVRAALMASLGFTGVPDVLDRNINFFDSFEGLSTPERLMELIESPKGGVFEADIKLYPVGLPIQAAAQAMDEILSTGIRANEVQTVRCHLPSQKAYIVDDRDMPPISLQFVLATMLEDGELTFANSHDQERLDRNRGGELMRKVTLVHDDDMNPVERSGSRNKAHLYLTTNDGRSLTAKVEQLKGTRFSPATWTDMERKAAMIFGSDSVKLGGLAQQVRDLAELGLVATLRTAGLLPG
ncbi:MmgE/PrpD family protein [Mesorhizobium sp. SB112]|uniref:MmgE/PrpD family protein n=1 Tax=Mesorhizobium sp. SB112 TaxID=3151853 RepID=UPI0032649BA2